MASSSRVLFAGIAFFVFPFVAIIALFSARNITTTPLVLPTFTTTLNGSSFDTTNQTTSAPLNGGGGGLNLPSLNFPYIHLIEEALAVLAIVLLGLFFARHIAIVGLRSRKADEGGEFNDPLQERRKAVASILDSASINLGRDSTKFREIVLECYRLILELLEDKSAISGTNLTAREFKELVSTALKFDSERLLEATKLFEVARYSQQEITREQALEAADCLRDLSKELANSTLESPKP
jgi:Domain of unknown function (DUF4129)